MICDFCGVDYRNEGAAHLYKCEPALEAWCDLEKRQQRLKEMAKKLGKRAAEFQEKVMTELMKEK